MNPQVHGKWKYANWCNNLATLRNAIARDRGRTLKDVAIYARDIAFIKSQRNQNTTVPWNRSAASKLLKQDITNGLHKTMRPAELYQTRSEYHNHFNLHEFRKHIYQEIDSRPKKDVRFQKKKKAWLYPEIHQDHPLLRDET